ncbi:MAG: ATP-binding protein [Oscillospiraceae bacterium]|nr:ATP-binding protein [Oscillospiraceae bacterium]
MAKIIALCGKVCSGKSTYAEKIRNEYNAVVLNADTLMLSLFDEQLGEKHDEIDRKVILYLYLMAEKIINTDTNVILDFGFWTCKARQDTRAYFIVRNIDIEFHYVNTPINVIKMNVGKRNENRDGASYYIDENILNKCLDSFEEPSDSETDFLVIENFAK